MPPPTETWTWNRTGAANRRLTFEEHQARISSGKTGNERDVERVPSVVRPALYVARPGLAFPRVARFLDMLAVMEDGAWQLDLDAVPYDDGFEDWRRFHVLQEFHVMRSQNKPVDPVVSEICKRNSIVAYLNSKGIELRKQGKRQVCKCPIPGHQDDTPSFCVWTTPDGTELWHCFGKCGKTGNIISLMRLMEKEPKDVFRRLAEKSGVSLKGFDEKAVRIDPLPSEIAEFLCQDDQLAIEMATWTIAFMKARGTVDAVEKVSRLYEKIDRLSEVGDDDSLQKVCVDLQRTLGKYR